MSIALARHSAIAHSYCILYIHFVCCFCIFLHKKIETAMNVKSTTNQDETSVTVTRSDGTSIDFVAMPGEITIGQNNPDGSHQDIVLTLQEAEVLREHLTAIQG